MLELPSDPWQWPDLAHEQIRELAEISADMGPEAPLFQYVAVRRCNGLKPEIDAGSGFAVLAAIRICGTNGLVVPKWLVYAFNRRYDAVLNFRAVSWDDPLSFGSPYPKGVNKNARRKARVLRFAVLNAINAIRMSEPGKAIDKGLFEQVGKPLSIGATLAEEYYYATKKMMASSSQNDHGGAAAKPVPYRMTSKANTARKSNTAGLRKRRR